MPVMSWQLWLARPEAQDHPLPWQKPLTNQTPGRVANAFASIFNGGWDPRDGAQTPRKVSRLAHREETNPKTTIPDGQKELFQAKVSS
jgi:hypothetical protein